MATKHEPYITQPEISDEYKVYKRRWIVLIIFVFYSASNAMQWVQYSIIADVISDYYGVPMIAIDWTSMIYMVLYIPFIFPASFILDKLGLRMAVLIGCIGTCSGSWIKVASIHPDRFWVTFIGQSIVAFSQIFVLSIPSRLAAVWFGPKQVSSACSIGVFGNQLGCAVGFLLPPMIVKMGSVEQVTYDLYMMFVGCAIFTTILLIAILTVFKDKPLSPPSLAETQKIYSDQDAADKNFFKSIKDLLLNRNYTFLLIAYGINVGIFYAISTLLNQIVLTYYPQNGKDAGIIGLVIVLAGMLGSVVCGIILDRYRRYKETTLVVYIFSLIGMVAYTYTLSTNIAVVYIVSAFLGFFMTGLLPIGFELAAELTYPEPEGTSAGLLNASAQIFGIIFTSIYSQIFNKFGDQWANLTMAAMLLLGTILTASIKSDLKRQAAMHEKNQA